MSSAVSSDPKTAEFKQISSEEDFHLLCTCRVQGEKDTGSRLFATTNPRCSEPATGVQVLHAVLRCCGSPTIAVIRLCLLQATNESDAPVT
jgi:predicted PhzF superfamily epimerase YddE/YHI9